jgi:hypothetical protein
MILANRDSDNNIAWHHISKEGWIAKAPKVDFILAIENCNQINSELKWSIVFEMLLIADSIPIDTDLKNLKDWLNAEVLKDIPSTYNDWLSIVFEISGQVLLATEINEWEIRPLRQLIYCYNLMKNRLEKQQKNV